MRQLLPLLARLIAGCFLIATLIGLPPLQPASAAPTSMTSPTLTTSSASGEDTWTYSAEVWRSIKEFLTSQPAGFYGIRTVEDLNKLINADRNYPLQEEVVLIDVRTPAEYSKGHIPTATNIPVEDLVDQLALIPRDKTVIVYCSTGYRAAMAVESLHLLGFDKVQGFTPGFQAWRQAGEAIEIG